MIYMQFRAPQSYLYHQIGDKKSGNKEMFCFRNAHCLSQPIYTLLYGTALQARRTFTFQLCRFESNWKCMRFGRDFGSAQRLVCLWNEVRWCDAAGIVLWFRIHKQQQTKHRREAIILRALRLYRCCMLELVVGEVCRPRMYAHKVATSEFYTE